MVKKFTQKRKVYRRNRKRVYKAKRRQLGAKILRLPEMVPARLQTVLRYSDSKELTATAPTVSYNWYRTTSVFAPDYTGSGAQPGWFDFIKTAYRAYVVKSCRINLLCVNKSDEIVRVQTVLSSASDGPISSASNWYSLGKNARDILIPGNSGYKKISQFCDNYAVAGFSNTESRATQNNPFAAAVTGSPGLNNYFQIKAQTIDGTGTHAIIYKLEILYNVEFFDRKLTDGIDA